jgi:hypothetical protein
VAFIVVCPACPYAGEFAGIYRYFSLGRKREAGGNGVYQTMPVHCLVFRDRRRHVFEADGDPSP